ncbi:MAG TPA: DUF2007 domain-containing protein [Thermoanaerobaculia bacterium]|jgi:hypothetical protein|nr:DUF2007 domain-containing protein [Thermoanaerobaculia bacterium]
MDYELERLVTVGVYNSPWEAQLAKARLDAEGIDAVIADENFTRLYVALSSTLGGVKVQVREESAARAAELLTRPQPIPDIHLVTEEDMASEAIADPPALVTVARFATPWEAHLARTCLESEGIEACVFEERLPPVSLLTGEPLALNRLEVFETDSDRAAEILSREAWDEDEDLPASD